MSASTKWMPSLRAQLIVSVIGALLLSLLITLSQGVTSPTGIMGGLAIGMTYAAVIGPLMFVALPPLRHAIDGLSPWFRWAVLLGGAAVLAAVGSLLVQCVFIAFGWMGWPSYWHNYSIGVRIALVIAVGGTIAAELFSTLYGRLELAKETIAQRDREKERALRDATEARLASLESRLRPHFLFNSLNSATELTAVDPERAAEMLQRLANLLRFSLDSGQAGLVPLARELHVTQDYLEIERSRFGDRLRYAIEAKPELDEVAVPPLAIQTLVENSVKYAVAPRAGGGEIRVRARPDGDAVLLEVEDDGPGLGDAELSAGHGIDNVRSRLQVLYGDEAEIELVREYDGGLIRIRVPRTRPSKAP